MRRASVVLFLFAAVGFGQTLSRVGEYALILQDEPVARKVQTRAALLGAEARPHLQRIQAAQRGVLAELARRHVGVTGTSQLLLNAVFITADRMSADGLRDIPGVAQVIYLPPLKPALYTATDLIGAAQAAALAPGGSANAGAGVKIAIIDSGIDQNHAAFQDNSLTAPSGYPKGDSKYTNNKVIVARSYVQQFGLNSNTGAPWPDPDSRNSAPDDLTPRDHVGHGTAIAMIAAGARNTGPVAAIQGVAPKAFLGNYKVQGSPGVNNWVKASGVVAALTDAVADGMDVAAVAYSEGDMWYSGPLVVDVAYCGGDGVCDPVATAVENAIGKGLLVVTVAGNDGNLTAPAKFPTLNSIHSPGTASHALTVGATTNAHVLYQAVNALSPNPPSSLQVLKARVGAGPQLQAAITAYVKDVAQTGDDGKACAALPAGSLGGYIALVERGVCAYSDKITNAQNAGALAVIIYQTAGNETPASDWGDGDTGIPATMIGRTDGLALKTWVNGNAGATVKIDPVSTAYAAVADIVADFSSRGPAIGTLDLKPELVAPGAGIYTATQKLDPNSPMYDASGYTAATGTSMAVGFAAGSAALVKQKTPLLTPGQLKSALVNTATTNVITSTGAQRVTDIGAGKLSAVNAMSAGTTFEPATLSFGALAASSLPASLTLTVTNITGASQTVNLAAQPRDSVVSATLSITPSTLTLAAGQSSSVTVRLQGTRPVPGSYEGVIAATVGGSSYRVPYLFLVGEGTVDNVFPIWHGGFIGSAGDTGFDLALKAIDRFGVPVVSPNTGAANPSVQWIVVTGGGKFETSGTTIYVDNRTFNDGVAWAWFDMGTTPGDQIVRAFVNGTYTVDFNGWARPSRPTINAGGVVDAATSQSFAGLAPGSYVSIYGTYLAPALQVVPTPSLPYSLSETSVAFYAANGRFPGRLHFVSPGQINVQLPWELQGQTSATMVVKVGADVSDVYTVPLAQVSPGVLSNGAAILDFPGNKPVNQANPAARGSVIQLFANGLGPVDSALASGEPTPYPPLVHTNLTPTVSIGGIQSPSIGFSGMTANYVGLYQINVTVPSDAPTGKQPLIVTIGGVSSKATDLYVK
jgi:minor extracellular serine protease Vpr